MHSYTFNFENAAISDLSTEIQLLINEAIQATKSAYAPYSGFKVGAAILLADGTMKTGANMENAAYPATICAERAVLAGIDPRGELTPKVIAIAIAYDNGNDSFQKPLSPCGLCRQVILETQLAQGAVIKLYMTSPSGNVIVVNDARHLLPFYFSSELLKG